MSKHQLSKIIRREIQVLNEMIDLRIVRGMPYKKEAYRHKYLLKQLTTI